MPTIAELKMEQDGLSSGLVDGGIKKIKDVKSSLVSTTSNVKSQGIGSTIEELTSGDNTEEDKSAQIFQDMFTAAGGHLDKLRPVGAFLYALANGWSFGLLGWLLRLLGLGDFMDKLESDNPNLSTAGDWISYLSPGTAIKILKALTKFGARMIVKAIARKAGAASLKRSTAAKASFEAALKTAGKNGGDDALGFIATALGVNKATAKTMMKKLKIKGDDLTAAAMKVGYKNADAIVEASPKLVKLAKADKTLDKAINYLERFAKAVNVGIIDLYEITMVYYAVKRESMKKGFSEQESTDMAIAAAFWFAIVKGIGTQVIYRIMPKIREGFFRSMGIWAAERIAALGLLNLTDLDGMLGDAGEWISNTTDNIGNATFVKNKNSGGLIHMKNGGLVPMMNRGGLVAI